MEYRRLWIAFALVIVGSFTVLGYYGSEIYRDAPPVPEQVVTTDGRVLWTGAEIKDGQNVWQSTGGHELGTVWGHGSYVAPDWSADWLHREAVYMLDAWARTEHGLPFDQLAAEPKAALQARLAGERCARTPTIRPPATSSCPSYGRRPSLQPPTTTRSCSTTTPASPICAKPTP